MANNNQNNGIDKETLVLARVTSNGFIDVPKNAVLVTENVFTKKVSVISKPGIWFSIPGMYFNTLIYTNDNFTKVFGEEKFNATDMPEVRVIPFISYRITDFDKFYTQICGKDAPDVISLDSKRLEGMYNLIKMSIRSIIRLCSFELVENLKLMTIVDARGNEIYDKSNFLGNEHIFEKITQTFKSIENSYGIRIGTFGLNDVTLPEVVQQAQLEAKNAQFEREKKIAYAEAQKEIAEREAAALAIRIKAYEDAGIPPEAIARILMAENANSTVLYGGSGNENATEAMITHMFQQDVVKSSDEDSKNPRK